MATETVTADVVARLRAENEQLRAFVRDTKDRATAEPGHPGAATALGLKSQLKSISLEAYHLLAWLDRGLPPPHPGKVVVEVPPPPAPPSGYRFGYFQVLSRPAGDFQAEALDLAVRIWVEQGTDRATLYAVVRHEDDDHDCLVAKYSGGWAERYDAA